MRTKLMNLPAKIRTWTRQRLCGLHGHDRLLTLGKGTVHLVCSSCGYAGRGWDLTDLKPPKPVQTGIPRRHRIQRPRLTGIDWAGKPDQQVDVLRKDGQTVAIRRRRAAV